ncbi:MAG: hypothetical protein RL383_401, partial [Actinomycetota bacterium]
MSEGGNTLSERESKAVLSSYGVPFAEEGVATDAAEAARLAERLGRPVAVKLGGAGIAHKTERGLVRLGLSSPRDAENAARELLALSVPEDGEVHLLVAEMVRGTRELIAGLFCDPQFGPTVMVGVGGVLAEAVGDVVFRPAPVTREGAMGMLAQLRTQKLLGGFRGEEPVDRGAVADVLVALSRVATERPEIVSVDLNPLIVRPDGTVVAVDALVETGTRPTLAAHTRRHGAEGFAALFEPKGVLVTGASTHPGKFGFVSLHNILANGYRGAVHGTNLSGETVLGIETVSDIDSLPEGTIDLVFVCTPASANPDLLRACARKGIKAAFLTSAGYGEAGEEGRRLEAELVALADELGILLAGPNGQGVVSTPAQLCAQIVAPYPPAGSISVASQSGNFVSSFMNYARQTGVGISRAVSAGNAAALGVADLVEWYGTDARTKVSLAYVEGIPNGRDLMDRLGRVAVTKPVVVVKGGATEGGARAAASHTGALAANDAVFDG